MAAAITEEMDAPATLASEAQAAMGALHLQTALAVPNGEGATVAAALASHPGGGHDELHRLDARGGRGGAQRRAQGQPRARGGGPQEPPTSSGQLHCARYTLAA